MNGKPSKSLIQKVNAVIEGELLAVGCRKRRKEWYTFDIAPEYLGVVIISRSVERGNGVLYISPSIGIRSEKFQALYQELRHGLLDKKYDDYLYHPTLKWELENISNEDLECHYFHETLLTDENIACRCKHLVRSLMDNGLPIARKYASLNAICEGIINGKVSTLRRDKYLPIAFYFQRRFSEAKSVLKEEVIKEIDDFHGSVTYMKRFSERLLKKISELENECGSV
jgi:hypothetical protein